jgi:hypothetical protein
MSTLGHVLFLLPFLRDFARCDCIASVVRTLGALASSAPPTIGHMKEGSRAMLSVLSQFGTLPAITALLLALAVLVGAVGRVIRDVLTFRLVRRALKRKKARKALGDLAKVIAAQRGKRRRWPEKENASSERSPRDHPPMISSTSSTS